MLIILLGLSFSIISYCDMQEVGYTRKASDARD